MKIVIPGGTGQVGTLLARQLVADGHEVVVLSRTDHPALGAFRSGMARRWATGPPKLMARMPL